MKKNIIEMGMECNQMLPVELIPELLLMGACIVEPLCHEIGADKKYLPMKMQRIKQAEVKAVTRHSKSPLSPLQFV
ncbi:MAG: hypothetical protein D3911_06580 [Candidatus Electrothrix sp. AW3_4]|nr:hypothetical protein [Candidatus Electrothrix gigas]